MFAMSMRLRCRRQCVFAPGRGAGHAEGAAAVVISAQIEAEIAMLPREERVDYLEAVGLKETGLDRLIRAGYELFGS